MNILPESFVVDNKPYILNDKSKNVLILCDLHVPYHSNKAIKLAVEYSKANYKIDTIIINGDAIDFYRISRFIKNPDNPDLQSELDLTKQVLGYIRSCFPKAKIVFVEGNHENRLQKYIFEHNELLHLKCLKLEELLDFKKFRIDYVCNKQIIKFGKLIIMHGHEITGSVSGKTPSRNTLLKTMTNVLFAHLHRIDEYIFRKIDNSYLGSWSVGCLCDLSPEYAKYNDWCNGFAIVQRVDSKGEFIVHNKKIINEKVL